VKADLTGKDGSVFATVERTLYVTTRQYMAEKRKARQASQAQAEDRAQAQAQALSHAADPGRFEAQQTVGRPKETDDGEDLVKTVPP
jgi:hypothetical protein